MRAKDRPILSAGGIILIKDEEIIKKYYKLYNDQDITISYIELMTAYRGLKQCYDYFNLSFRKKYNITLYSDSMYVVKGFNEWMYQWEPNNWKNRSGVTVSQVNIWKKLYKKFVCSNKTKIRFVHVKAHTKKQDRISVCNDICDKLANKGVSYLKSIYLKG